MKFFKKGPSDGLLMESCTHYNGRIDAAAGRRGLVSLVVISVSLTRRDRLVALPLD